MKKVNGVMFKEGNKAAEKWTEERALDFANEMIDWMSADEKNVFFEEFIYIVAPKLSNYLDITFSVDTPSYLARKYPSFLERIGRAKKIQEVKLKKGGAFDDMNASIVRFLLSAEHGLSEKSIVESNTNITTSPKTLDDWYNDSRSNKDE